MTPDDLNTTDLRAGRPEAGATRADSAITTDDETMRQLAVTLGELRRPRPGFQEELQARLVARLPEVREPWWRRALLPVPVPMHGRVSMRRRTMLGAAAAGALALFAVSLAIPLDGRAPEASAREILEKVQAASENPILAGVKSFHLTATSTGTRRDGAAGTVTTEQWFVAPDKMRTETRTKLADGSTALAGFLHDGANARHYASANARESLVVGVFAVPVGAPAPGGERPGEATPGWERPADAPPLPGRPISKPAHGGAIIEREVHVGGPGEPGGPHGAPAAGDIFVVRAERTDGPGEPGVEEHATVTTFACPEPERKGEATVAGRRVFVVEADMRACVPEGAPDDLRGRHVRWVDQQTFLPLKMEMYDKDGKLVDRYEVTSIEYDVAIAESTFSQLPPGTTVQEPKLLPPIPRDGVRPGILPATKPAGR